MSKLTDGKPGAYIIFFLSLCPVLFTMLCSLISSVHEFNCSWKQWTHEHDSRCTGQFMRGYEYPSYKRKYVEFGLDIIGGVSGITMRRQAVFCPWITCRGCYVTRTGIYLITKTRWLQCQESVMRRGEVVRLR